MSSVNKLGYPCIRKFIFRLLNIYVIYVCTKHIAYDKFVGYINDDGLVSLNLSILVIVIPGLIVLLKSP